MANVVTNNDKLTAEQQRELLRQLLERKAQQPRQIPLSLNQESLWFLDRLDPGRPTYSVYPAFRISGPLNLDALQKSLNEIVSRHEVLRTTFPEVDGVPVQQVAPRQQQEMTIIDLTERPPAEREQELQRIAKVHLPIDLQTGPVLRYRLVRLADDDHVFMMDIHHIVYDGWSLGVFLREMLGLYYAFCDGKPSPLPELSLQYGDFAAWQRDFLQGDRLEELSAYWKDRLSDIQPLDFSTDYPRPAIRTTRGATLPIELSAELSQEVLDFSRRERVTPFMTLLAGFEELLHRYTAQENFAIGTPVANRRQKDLEPLIGYFVNMLVVPADMSGDLSFRELVQRVRTTALESFEHQALTLEKVVDAVQPVRDMSRHPLFQVMFVLQSNPEADWQLPDLEVVPVDEFYGDVTAKFEMTVPLRITPEGIVGKFNYNTDLFARETIERMIAHYQMILADAIASPEKRLSSLPLLLESEQQTILRDWNATETSDNLDTCIHTLFEAQVEKTPDAIALVDGDQKWTYRQLNVHANQLAHNLISQGAGPDKLIAVRLPRSANLIISLLAILKSGSAYLPLDPHLPTDRLHFMLDDAEVSLVLTEQHLTSDLPDEFSRVICLDEDSDRISAHSFQNPTVEVTPQNLAYVIFTSGSTGQPKGVMIEHHALVNYTLAAVHEYEITSDDNILQFASVSFDGHVEEIYPCLTQGGTLFLRTDEMLYSIEEFLRCCEEWKISVLSLPTAFWHVITEELEHDEVDLPECIESVLIGGERALSNRVQAWFDNVGEKVRLLNTYGPTETTVVATSTELSLEDAQAERIPIGRPLKNMKAYVLNERLRPVPVGVHGELFIGGESVARGYLNRPTLTNERFVPDPFSDQPAARMYRTGDVVSWKADGRLEFIGRTDHQVKIRGFRIEPGEVEEVLRKHPRLSEVAVLACERSMGDTQLVAYIVGYDDDVAEMRKYLGDRLPEYMIPSAFVVLDKMPKSSSGKIDRKALLGYDQIHLQKREHVAPRSETEQKLVKIWKDVLQVERIGIHDNFFDLGGSSLMILRLTGEIKKAFQVEVPIVKVFQNPTVAALGDVIETLRLSGVRTVGPPLKKVPREGLIPTTITQGRMVKRELNYPGRTNQIITGVPILGKFDLEAFQKTLDEIVRRHEILRTTYREENGEIYQVISPTTPAQLKLIDLSGSSDSEQEAVLQRESESHKAHLYDLERGPMYRFTLLRNGAEQHLLLISLSHCVYDAWSMGVYGTEFNALYNAFAEGRPSPLPELTVQIADYAIWQREYLQKEILERLEDHWREKLEGAVPISRLGDLNGTDAEYYDSQKHRFSLSVEISKRIKEYCKEHRITPSVFFMSILKVLVSRHTNKKDITLRVSNAGRSHPELQRLIGPFQIMFPMRTDLSGDPTVSVLLERVRQTTLDAYDHQGLPYSLSLKAAGFEPNRKIVYFNYLESSVPAGKMSQEGLLIEQLEIAREDSVKDGEFELHVIAAKDHFHSYIQYRTDCVRPETIARYEKQYMALLNSCLSQPAARLSELPQTPRKGEDAFPG